MKLEPQYDWISDKNDNILVDFIGRYEKFQDDWRYICKKINISPEDLPVTHKTSKNHYTEYYDDETREIVAEIYAKDIDYFGYKFGE